MHLACRYERLSFEHAAHSHGGGVDKHACLGSKRSTSFRLCASMAPQPQSMFAAVICWAKMSDSARRPIGNEYACSVE